MLRRNFTKIWQYSKVELSFLLGPVPVRLAIDGIWGFGNTSITPSLTQFCGTTKFSQGFPLSTKLERVALASPSLEHKRWPPRGQSKRPCDFWDSSSFFYLFYKIKNAFFKPSKHYGTRVWWILVLYKVSGSKEPPELSLTTKSTNKWILQDWF